MKSEFELFQEIDQEYRDIMDWANSRGTKTYRIFS